ncbi:MAG: S9 family peptidase [Phototrophicaceae bacterium]
MNDEKRLITIEDLVKIKYVQDPQISPDGQWIAYVVMSTNQMDQKYDRDIYLAASDGSQTVRLTRSGNNTSPCWSPDGKHIAFVSTRAERPQIYVLPVQHAGEARALTSHANGAVAPAWSPDSQMIAYLSSSNIVEREQEDSNEKPAPPTDKLEGKHRSERKKEDEKMRWDPHPMERIPYRQGTSFTDDRHAQIYIIPVDEALEGDDAKPRRLTSAETSYSPPQWSKSGRTIVTTRAWDEHADENWKFSNIYMIEVESGVERRFKDDAYSYFEAIPSYDGDWLICTRQPSGSTDSLARLTLISLEGGHDPVDLNLELDRGLLGYDWVEDGTLLTLVSTEGRVEVHSLDPKTKQFTPIITSDQVILGFDARRDGTFAYVSRTTDELPELFYMDASTNKRLSNVNQAFVDEVQIQATHEIWFENPEGQKIQGWYILPPNYEDGKQYPLALNIHGGPHVMWTPSTPAMWHEWQTHAAAGYVVFFCNPRGSAGYGQKHVAAIRSNWGKVTMDDVMAGVDAMIAKGLIDESRMAITGGSFGGYMTAWIIGNSDRFVSAVPQRGVYNISSFYGTSDVPRLMSSEFEAEPWEDRDKFWAHSPLAYAHNIKTPTLIIHSENDYRVPIEQAEQLFAWIRRATDTPVKMLRYPREGHELSRSGEPAHRISRLKEMINWFDKYCQPEKITETVETQAVLDDE